MVKVLLRPIVIDYLRRRRELLSPAGLCELLVAIVSVALTITFSWITTRTILGAVSDDRLSLVSRTFFLLISQGLTYLLTGLLFSYSYLFRNQAVDRLLAAPVKHSDILKAATVLSFASSLWFQIVLIIPTLLSVKAVYLWSWNEFSLALLTSFVVGYLVQSSAVLLAALIRAITVNGLYSRGVSRLISVAGQIILPPIALILTSLIAISRGVSAIDFSALLIGSSFICVFLGNRSIERAASQLMVELSAADKGLSRTRPDLSYCVRSCNASHNRILAFARHVFAFRQTSPVIAVALKEFKVFCREPLQSVYFLLVLAFIWAFSPDYELARLELAASAKVLPISFSLSATLLSMLTVGSMVVALSGRHAQASISLEGQNYWLLQAAPIKNEEILRGKYLFWSTLLGMIGIVIVTTLSCALDVGIYHVLVAGIVMKCSADLITALAVSYGADHRILNWTYTAEVYRTAPTLILSLISLVILVGAISWTIVCEVTISGLFVIQTGFSHTFGSVVFLLLTAVPVAILKTLLVDRLLKSKALAPTS